VETGPISIRVAEPSDVEQIIAVSLGVRGVPGGNPHRAIADPQRLFVVAETVDGTIVGWAKTHYFDSPAESAPAGHYLGGVNVLPDYRLRGIGSALTRPRLEWIFERAPEAWFFTNARNIASIELHARLGFREVARASELHGVAFEGGVGILFSSSSVR
jgi:aminoglycoside 6'-N-acetyltransferase I